MDTFEEIQNNWAQQTAATPNEEALNKVVADVSTASKQYKGNQLVLGITAIVVSVFALSVSGFSTNITAWGFSLMIGCLLVRIILEAYHNYKMRTLDLTLESKQLQKLLLKHFNQRKWVHYLATPLCFGAYIWGFVLLLPSFKAALSPGFYTYIIVSGIVVLVSLSALLIFIIKKETRLHKQLQHYFIDK